MIFGVPSAKDARGSGADDPDGVLNVALRRLHAELGDDTVIMADLCLDEFTDHGHCGVLDERGRVDNDATLERYRGDGRRPGEAGRAPGRHERDDGRPGGCRAHRARRAGHTDTGDSGYAAKYASGFYGPFREAVNSS